MKLFPISAQEKKAISCRGAHHLNSKIALTTNLNENSIDANISMNFNLRVL